MLRSRRVLIFASLMAAALALGTGLTSASATPKPSYPAALGAFSPNGVVPGHWHLVRKTGVLYLTSGLLAGCHGAGSSWQRKDGTQIRLLWAACGKQEINLLSATYAVRRTRIPVSYRHLSILGANVDLVEAEAGGLVWRYWLQGNLSLALVSICHHEDTGSCAGLTAPAARYLAARLPGQPVVTKATSVLPPTSGLLGALVLLSLMVVGGDRISKRAKLEKFDMDPGSQRLHRVDQAADELQKVSRRRWWGKLFVIAGVGLFTAGVVGIVRRGPADTAGTVVFSLLLGAGGLAMLRRYRHPMLARERYHSRVPVTEAFHTRRLLSARHIRRLLSARHTRRLLSAGLTLVLSLLSFLVPVVVLAGWVLAGLASAEQDLSSILAGLVIAAVIVGYFIDRAAQRLRARNLQEAMKRDPHPMLYLRNFGDDNQKILTSRFNRRGVWQRSTGWLNPIGNARFEEVLARALAHSGAVAAVGQPGGKLHNLFSAIAPTLGAAKTTLAQDDWQNDVLQMAKNARAVVVSATPAQVNRGFAWELHTLAKDIEHGRVILAFGTGTKTALHRRFAAFVNTVSTYPLFQDLASGWISDGTLILVHDPADGWGTWRGWGAERRTAWTYTAAIGAAMAYAEKAWARPPAKLIPPREEPPAHQRQAGGNLVNPDLTGPWLAGLPLTETVESALRAAGAEASRHGQPLDTKTLLVALMDADSNRAGDWGRIWLNSRSREAIEQAGYKDPPLPGCQWNNVALTRACEKALETAWRVSQQYRLTPLQPGILVLGLIDDKSNAASRALNINNQDQQRVMARLVQEDLIGTSLIGLRLGSTS